MHASAIPPDEEPEDEDAVPDDDPDDELEPDEEPEPEEELDPDEDPEPEDELDPDDEDEPEDDPDEDEDPDEEPEDEDADPEEDPEPVPPPLVELEQAPTAAADVPMPRTTITWKSFRVVFKASPGKKATTRRHGGKGPFRQRVGLPQQQPDQVLVHASAIEPDEEPEDDEDAVPDEEPVVPEEEPECVPDEEPEVVGPELEVLEQPVAPTVATAADAPMPTTTMTWNSFFVVLTASPMTNEATTHPLVGNAPRAMVLVRMRGLPACRRGCSGVQSVGT